MYLDIKVTKFDVTLEFIKTKNQKNSNNLETNNSIHLHVGRVLLKQALGSLSISYKKKLAGTSPGKPSFGMAPTKRGNL